MILHPFALPRIQDHEQCAQTPADGVEDEHALDAGEEGQQKLDPHHTEQAQRDQQHHHGWDAGTRAAHGAGIHSCGEKIDKLVAREDFSAVAELILSAVKASRENDVMSPDGVEEFLDEVAIFDLEAKTDDRTDFYVAFYSADAPLTGFCVRSRLSSMFPLLDGGRTANLKFEQTGIKFATPTVNKINAFGEEDDVAGRMLMIERLGGVSKYTAWADKVFRSNLSMIDLHFPRMLGEMLRIMHLDGITRVSELTEVMKQVNPLKIKEELITKHHYYEYKMKQFLLALALGMRPAKLFTGVDSAVSGFLLVDGSGEILCYQKAKRLCFQEIQDRNCKNSISNFYSVWQGGDPIDILTTLFRLSFADCSICTFVLFAVCESFSFFQKKNHCFDFLYRSGMFSRVFYIWNVSRQHSAGKPFPISGCQSDCNVLQHAMPFLVCLCD